MPTYTITSRPAYGEGTSTSSALHVGDRVELHPDFSTPDYDGDVKVYQISSDGRRRSYTPRYVRFSALTRNPEPEDFPVGARVSVLAGAKTTSGGGVYFDSLPLVATVRGRDALGNVLVEDADGMDQYVAPTYLEILPEETTEDAVEPEISAASYAKALSVFEALSANQDNPAEAVRSVARIVQG